MKAARTLTLALAFAAPAIPSTLLANDDDPRSDDRRADDLDDDDRRPDAKLDARARGVKTNVVPAIAGIEIADKATAALYELATLERLDAKEARETVDLAKQGVEIALDRAEALDRMKQLSGDARSETSTMKDRLESARTTLQQLDKQLTGRVQRDDLEQIREHARNVHDALSQAEDSAERVARAYDVSTDLEFGG